MFPLHQSNELCFQISPNPEKNRHTISSEDLILDSASLEDHNISDPNKDRIETRSHRRRLSISSNNNNPQSSSKDSKDGTNSKIKHRDIERQRRQEMATLHASLRSLLPLQLIKGKRSISDHINEAARYIKHLETKIKELGVKRDDLKIRFSDPNLTDPTTRVESSNSSSLCRGQFTIQPCHGGSGVEIVIFASAGDGGIGILPLSRVLEVLLGEGHGVVSCISAKVNGRFLHTIRSEASDNREYINIPVIEQKLSQLIDHGHDV